MGPGHASNLKATGSARRGREARSAGNTTGGRRAHLPAENVAGPETQLRAQWGFAAKPFEPDRTQGVRQPGLSPAQVPCTPVHTRVPLSHTPHCWPALRDLPQGPAGLAATSSPSPAPPEAQQHLRPCVAPEPWRHETPCGPRPDSLSRAHVWTAVRWLSSSRPSSPPLPRATWVRQVGQRFRACLRGLPSQKPSPGGEHRAGGPPSGAQ